MKFKIIIKKNYKYLIFLILLILFLHLKLPFYIYKNGGYVNLNERISISNKEIKGSFNMSYVSVIKGTPFFVVLANIVPSWDLIEKNKVIPEEINQKEKLKIDLLQTNSSIEKAIYLAYTKASKEVVLKNEKFIVSFIDNNALTNLELFDEIININGKVFNSITGITDYIKSLSPEKDVTILVKRKNQEFITTSKFTEYEKDFYLIGLSFIKTFEINTDPKIDIKFKKSELGPSAGLMLALTIYSSLKEVDLTKGKTISGTGTIDEEGNVGKIGGLKYKMLGSKKSDVFLVPKEQLIDSQLIKEKYNLKFKLVGVNTFDEATEYLNKL
jgi:PDZ domain-containing protein